MEKLRNIGKLKVSPIGFGCMALSHGYGPTIPKEEAVELIRKVFKLGCNFMDTAEGYGHGDNERIVGEAIKPFRKDIVLATKLHLNSSEAKTLSEVKSEIRRRLYCSLERLQTDYVDIYYQHRVAADIPVEYVAEAMGELINDGLIKGWGQSQATEEEIRRAHSVTPLTAIQSEYSLMERMWEKDVIPTCEELGIGFIPFSPMASGFLSGKYKPGDDYVGDDVRRVITRYYPENIKRNMPLLELVDKMSKEKKCSMAQISLAWMLHKKPFIVPIPGPDNLEYMKENIGAASIEFSEEEFKRFEEALSKIKIYGNRTDEDIGKLGTVRTK